MLLISLLDFANLSWILQTTLCKNKLEMQTIHNCFVYDILHDITVSWFIPDLDKWMHHNCWRMHAYVIRIGFK